MLCLLLTWTPIYRHSTSTATRVFSSGTQGQDPLCLLCWRCCHNFSDKQPRITFTTCKDDDEIRLDIDQRCWGESSLSLLQLHFCSGIMHRPLLLSFTQNIHAILFCLQNIIGTKHLLIHGTSWRPSWWRILSNLSTYHISASYHLSVSNL